MLVIVESYQLCKYSKFLFQPLMCPVVVGKLHSYHQWASPMKNNVISFLLKRRSVVAKKMLPEEPAKEDLENIIACGLRVPDHSNVQPWRIVVLQGGAKRQFDEQVILKAAQADSKEPLSEAQQQLESQRMQRGGVVIAVLSTPVVPHKIPVWEQQLSAGAMCTNLLLAAQSLDYAAQWLTEWPAYHTDVISALGGNPGADQIAGFIHIGKKEQQPDERKRPATAEKVSWWKAPNS